MSEPIFTPGESAIAAEFETWYAATVESFADDPEMLARMAFLRGMEYALSRLKSLEDKIEDLP